MGFFKSVGDKLGDTLFGGGKRTTYTPPNLDFLRSPAERVNYDFLRNPVAGSGDNFKAYADAIGAPSSVDEVRAGMNKEQVDALVGDIYRDTRGKFGKDLMTSFGRGLFDPSAGASSDIAANNSAQIAASGARTAADARTKYALADLDRQAEREKALRDAYGNRYQLETQVGNQRDLAYAGGLESNVNRDEERKRLLAQLLTGQAGTAAANTTRTPGWLNIFGENAAKSGGESAGKNLPLLFL